jgi:DNA-binding response OmpR family regulator
VEDDADAAYYAVHVLTRMGGFEVSHTPDPAVALERARSLPFDLVLTDVDLPGMTGSELLGALRQAVPALPVAVMTARAATDGSLNGLRRQVDALLHKPVAPDRLVAVVSALIPERAGWWPGSR